MSTIPVELYKALQKVGVSEREAEVAAKSVWDNNQLVTKSDIAQLSHETAEVKGELKLIKWILALIVIVQVIPLLKGLFAG